MHSGTSFVQFPVARHVELFAPSSRNLSGQVKVTVELNVVPDLESMVILSGTLGSPQSITAGKDRFIGIFHRQVLLTMCWFAARLPHDSHI